MQKKFLVALLSFFSLFSVTPTSASDDLRIWDKLQGTAPQGYVLLLRHSLAPGVGDPENFRLGDCTTQRNLSDVGREDAAELGEWIKRRAIKIYRVESSRWCRAAETAKLLNLGAVKLNKNLDSLFQESDAIGHPQTRKIRKQIRQHRDKRGLLIMVGHFVNISALTGVGVNSGEGILVRADNRGELRILGSTPPFGR